jgi:sodium/bile acid cotransporter 3/5
MFDNKLFRLGLFVLGCSPGGNGSNFWTLLLNGDINLSITMTFVSTIAALGMMPLWIFLLGPYISDGDLVIPYTQLVTTLLLLIGPIAIGMWIRHRFEKGAKIMKAIIVPFTLLTVLFIFTAGIYINLFIFMLMTGKMVAAGFVVAFCGYSFGAVFAWLCKYSKSYAFEMVFLLTKTIIL